MYFAFLLKTLNSKKGRTKSSSFQNCTFESIFFTNKHNHEAKDCVLKYVLLPTLKVNVYPFPRVLPKLVKTRRQNSPVSRKYFIMRILFHFRAYSFGNHKMIPIKCFKDPFLVSWKSWVKLWSSCSEMSISGV